MTPDNGGDPAAPDPARPLGALGSMLGDALRAAGAGRPTSEYTPDLATPSGGRARRGPPRPGGAGDGRPPAPAGRAVRRLAMLAGALVLAVAAVPTMTTYISPGPRRHRHPPRRRRRRPDAVGPGAAPAQPAPHRGRGVPHVHADPRAHARRDRGLADNDEINVNSQEGQPLSVDVSMSFELDPTRVPALYQTFRTDVATIQHGYIKQTIRQALQEVIGSEQIADIIGPKKAEAVARAQGLVAQRLAPYGIVVKQFTLNELRAPDAVMQAINQKNVMQQQALTAQNELQKNTFQAQGDSIKAAGRAKAITAEAEAQARANQLLAQSVTPTLVQYEMAKKWNGQMPQVSGGAVPMIQLPGQRP
jgi:regulator of protease activity HflC (stomatin/prohibitin superfamily)